MKRLLILAFSFSVAGCVAPQYYATSNATPVQFYTAPEPTSFDLRAELEGCSIVAEDGQMLGVITSNHYDSNSLLNEYGAYGGKYSSTSIWNEYSQYGGQYSSMSPFNSYTNTPPRIISRRGQLIGFLTVNQFKGSGISPYALVALMK